MLFVHCCVASSSSNNIYIHIEYKTRIREEKKSHCDYFYASKKKKTSTTMLEPVFSLLSPPFISCILITIFYTFKNILCSRMLMQFLYISLLRFSKMTCCRKIFARRAFSRSRASINLHFRPRKTKNRFFNGFRIVETLKWIKM